MSHNRSYLVFAFLCLLLLKLDTLSAQEGRKVKDEIKNTASWNQPNSSIKYLTPKITKSMRAVNQFVRQNQKMKSMPQSNFKVGSTSSRKFVAKPPSDPKEVDSGRSVRELTQRGNPLLPGHASSPTSARMTSSRRYVPQSPKDNHDVDRGRSASLLALSLASKKDLGNVNSARTALQMATMRKERDQDNIRIGREVQNMVRQSKGRARNPMLNSGSCYRSTFCGRNN